MNAGTNPRVVQRHLGHSNIRTTMIYDRPSMGTSRWIIDEAWHRLRKPGPRTLEQIQMEAIEKVCPAR